MNHKIILTFAVLAVAICGASCYAIMDAEEADAVSYTVTLTASTGGILEDTFGNVDTVIGLEIPSGTSYLTNGNRITFYTSGNNISVVATADTGYAFDRWSSTSGTVNGNKSITAYFAESSVQYRVIISADPLAAGYLRSTQGEENHTLSFNVTPNSSYSAAGSIFSFTSVGGTYIRVLAYPNDGYNFDSWSSRSGTFSSEVTWIYANFEVAPTSYTLTFRASTGGTLEDTYGDVDTEIGVLVAPGTTYTSSGEYVRFRSINGNDVVVNAVANTGYVFDRWSSVSGTVNSDTTIYAYFVESVVQYRVIISADPLAGGIIRSTQGEESHTLSFYVTPNSSYFTSGATLYFTTASGDNTHVTTRANSGYIFDSWSSDSGSFINETTRINANFIEVPTSYTLTFRASTGGTLEDTYGDVDTEIGVLVAPGTTYTSSGEYVRFRDVNDNDVVVNAVANTGYVFDRWSSVSGTVDRDMTITAYFNASGENGVFWTNENYNGRIDIIFDFSGNGTQTVTGSLYIGSSTGVANWTSTGYAVQVDVQKTGTQTRVGAQILQGTTVIKSNATGGSWPNVGSWDALQVSIDPENAQVVFTPVSVLNSFTDYKLYDSQARTMLSWGEVLESSAIRTLQHEASGDAIRFSVVNTRVFLDTYNAVLFDPRINVREKFPQYDSVRLNFYSFALYGDSITVNGRTYPVTGDKVTITYIDKDGVHYAVGAVADGEQRTRDFTLSNIYVSWDALTGHCSLTFVDDRWTLNMGTYNNTVVSFAGMWYFYTMLYNSHLSEEKTLGDWKVLPDISQSQMILIYLGILAVAGVAGLVHIRRGGNATLDLIVIGCAGLVGYIMLG